ncbi:MAG: hypothetical protein J7J91_11510 [Deltaproteobacteria bacterium]|nr:hypothetical protein [Deltaproteobacteria bacterium]
MNRKIFLIGLVLVAVGISLQFSGEVYGIYLFQYPYLYTNVTIDYGTCGVLKDGYKIPGWEYTTWEYVRKEWHVPTLYRYEHFVSVDGDFKITYDKEYNKITFVIPRLVLLIEKFRGSTHEKTTTFINGYNTKLYLNDDVVLDKPYPARGTYSKTFDIQELVDKYGNNINFMLVWKYPDFDDKFICNGKLRIEVLSLEKLKLNITLSGDKIQPADGEARYYVTVKTEKGYPTSASIDVIAIINNKIIDKSLIKVNEIGAGMYEIVVGAKEDGVLKLVVTATKEGYEEARVSDKFTLVYPQLVVDFSGNEPFAYLNERKTLIFKVKDSRNRLTDPDYMRVVLKYPDGVTEEELNPVKISTGTYKVDVKFTQLELYKLYVLVRKGGITGSESFGIAVSESVSGVKGTHYLKMIPHLMVLVGIGVMIYAFKE